MNPRASARGLFFGPCASPFISPNKLLKNNEFYVIRYVMADSSPDVQFPINQALLDETTKLREERMVLSERMAKIEATRDQVSQQVFDRVSGEYRSKFDAITQSLLEKKAEVDRELSTLYDTRQKVTANLEVQKTAIEELQFRKQLGEFDDKEFDNRAKEAKDKLGKFQLIVEAVNANIKKYEVLFSDFEPAPMEPSHPTPVAINMASVAGQPKRPSTGATTTIPVKRKSAGEDYNLPPEQSQNYFSSADDVSERPTGVAPPPAPPKTQRTQVYTAGGSPATGAVSSSSTSPSIRPGTAHIKVIRGAADSPKYPLGKETTIGRAHTNHIVLKEARISRQHAIIRQAGKEFVIEDLQSSNGIFVNGEKVKEHVLSDNDQIQIGDFVMEFHQ